jgi:D-arabinose 1-dehydrogenase-like Zn-dependent alcohol dehydrogenase
MTTMSTIATPELQATDTSASTYRAAQACRLGHTDIHAARGDWPVKPPPPFIPGHEGVGIVTHKTQCFSGPLSGEQE